MKLRPLQDRIIVERIEEETTTAGGIINDGLDDITFLTEVEANAGTVVEVTAETPCGGERGTDNDSSTADWGDN